MLQPAQKFLVAYSGLLTLALGVIVLTGATGIGNGRFSEIDVERINIREADGSLRMVLSNRERLPGLIVKGEEVPHERPMAGMLFFNDEGTENGGLIFAGRRDADGNLMHGVHLSMDQYQQDQVLALNSIEQGDRRVTGLTIGDRPQRSILDDLRENAEIDAMPEDARRALLQERYASGYYGNDRLFVGRTAARESQVELKDEAGRARLRLNVSPEGDASIEFLDEQGQVVKQL